MITAQFYYHQKEIKGYEFFHESACFCPAFVWMMILADINLEDSFSVRPFSSTSAVTNSVSTQFTGALADEISKAVSTLGYQLNGDEGMIYM